MNLRVVEGLLKATKIQLDTATSGKDCLNLVQERKYDIVFLDHMMPEMDGVETLQKFKELEKNPNKDTPVIMLTANAIVGSRDEYLAAGFTDYLSKPIQEMTLLQMILDYLPKDLIEQPQDTEQTEQEEPMEKTQSSRPEQSEKAQKHEPESSEKAQSPEPERTEETATKQAGQLGSEMLQKLDQMEGFDVKTGLTYCMNQESLSLIHI